MYNTLELGEAGTNEWLAASKNMKIMSNSYFGLTAYDDQAAVHSFTRELFEADLKKVSRKITASEPAEELK